MRNMISAGKAWFIFLLIAPALAQSRLTTPSPAATGPTYDISTGYTYLAMPLPSAGNVRLNGFDVSGSIDWSPRWGAVIDTNYLRASDVLSVSHPSYVLETQAGPKFYVLEHANTRIFVRALAGAALVDSAVPDNKTGFYHGWLVRPSFAAGAGLEQAVSGHLALRLNEDYLRTSFYDSAGAVLPQNNLRLTLSIVFQAKRNLGRF